MDGVLFRMDDPLPGAAEAVRRVRERGDLVRFLTNNSSKSRNDYVRKLSSFDIPSSPDEIMTSAHATALLFAELGQVGKRVYVVGENGLESELSSGGMRVVQPTDGEPVDF